MKIDFSINPSELTEQLVIFIQQTLIKTGFTRLVIGLSGGIDSATSLALGVKAIGAENIFVGIFPYGELNKEGADDARILTNTFNIPDGNVKLIDIKPLVDPMFSVIPDLIGNPDSRVPLQGKRENDNMNLRRGNIMVRMRMILLYDLAKKINGLVLGTENKTEHLLGYFTRFGDEASDVEPLINLYKTQVKQLAIYLELPQKIIGKPPTAGMWVGQTDENEFEFSYKDADQILYLWHDKKYKKEEIIERGFNSDIVDKVMKRVKDNDFKHKLPYTIEI